MNIITRSTRQPTPQERLGNFKIKAVHVPELSFVMGNQFYKQFNQQEQRK